MRFSSKPPLYIARTPQSRTIRTHTTRFNTHTLSLSLAVSLLTLELLLTLRHFQLKLSIYSSHYARALHNYCSFVRLNTNTNNNNSDRSPDCQSSKDNEENFGPQN